VSATPEQIADELDEVAGEQEAKSAEEWLASMAAAYLNEAKQLRTAAALIRAQAQRVRVLEGLLQRLEPSIGWRSATGTSRDFACEFCHQTHEHFAHIEHTDACPVTQVRAALKAAP
jgi:hypothetical protein